MAYPRVMGHEVVGTTRDRSAARANGSSSTRGSRAADASSAGRPGRTSARRAGCSVATGTAGCARSWPSPRRTCTRSPTGSTPRTAPLLQVLATCVHAQRRSRVFPGESVVVLGLGVTGLLHLQLAKLGGAGSADRGHEVGAEARDRARAGRRPHGDSGRDRDPGRGGAAPGRRRPRDRVRRHGRRTWPRRWRWCARAGGSSRTERSRRRPARSPSTSCTTRRSAIIGARSARVEDFPFAIDAVASGRVALDPLVSARHPARRRRRRDPSGGRAGSAQGARRCVSRAGEREVRATDARGTAPAVELRRRVGADRRADRPRSGRPPGRTAGSGGCSSDRTAAARPRSWRSRALAASPRPVASPCWAPPSGARTSARSIRGSATRATSWPSGCLPACTSETVVLTGKRATLSPWFQEFDEDDRAARGDAARSRGMRAPRRAALRHGQPGRAATGPPRPRAVPRTGAR